MQDDHSHEQYYQSLIKLHMNKIITAVAVLVIGGMVYEAYGYYNEKKRIHAQEQFEEYLESPNSAISATHTDILSNIYNTNRHTQQHLHTTQTDTLSSIYIQHKQTHSATSAYNTNRHTQQYLHAT